MLQHLLCFLCPWQALAALPDQCRVLGWESERKVRSRRMLVSSLSIPHPPDVEGRPLPVPRRRTRRDQRGKGRNRCLIAQEGFW